MNRFTIATILGLLVIAGCEPTEPTKPLVGPITHWAERGDVLAQYNLGLMYETGQGVTASIDQAKHWYQTASQSVADEESAAATSGAMGSGNSVSGLEAVRAASAAEAERASKDSLLRMYASLQDGLQDASEAKTAARKRLADLP